MSDPEFRYQLPPTAMTRNLAPEVMVAQEKWILAGIAEHRRRTRHRQAVGALAAIAVLVVSSLSYRSHADDVTVICHGLGSREELTVRAADAGFAAAFEACGSPRLTSVVAAGGPDRTEAQRSERVRVCRASAAELHLFLDGSNCAARGMTAVPFGS